MRRGGGIVGATSGASARAPAACVKDERRPFPPHVLPLGVMLAAVLLVLGDVLFGDEWTVLSGAGHDTFREFVFWKQFAARELSRGNLPLWNPHVFSGIPFLGGFQAGLLYPPNLLFVVMPVPRALNWLIALHLWLAGLGMYAWARRRGVSAAGATLAGLVFLFSAPVAMRILAGHFNTICSMAWTPMVLMGVDGLFAARGRLLLVLIGSGAVCMQVLAGHPQTVYFTAIGAGLLWVWRWVAAWRMEGHTARDSLGEPAGLVVIFGGGAALAAAQLLPGIYEAGFTVRSGGLARGIAAMFSLPPENLATLLVPELFGEMVRVPYWGRWYLWETCAFVGVGSAVLAAYGLVRGARPARVALGWLLGGAILLALGSYTPLWEVLYEVLPGFDRFRGSSKFILLAAAALALLAGAGWDALRASGAAAAQPGATRTTSRAAEASRRAVSAPLIIAVAGVVLLVAAAVLPRDTSGWMDWMRQSNESYFYSSRAAHDPELPIVAARLARMGCVVAGGTLLLWASLWPAARRRSGIALLLLGLAAIEPAALIKYTRTTFDIRRTQLPQPLVEYLQRQSGQPRVLMPLGLPENAPMAYGLFGLWGSDPGVPRRYAELLTWSQGRDPDEATQYLSFERYSPALRLLRAEYLLLPSGIDPQGSPLVMQTEGLSLYRFPPALPRALVVHRARVIPDRDGRFAALRAERFDPQAEVILETEPAPAPEALPDGAAKAPVEVVDVSSDVVEISVALERPGILVLTDAYHPGWRVEARRGSAQPSYTLLPANHCQRAVPLSAGVHNLRMRYAPRAFDVGCVVSIAAAMAWIAAFFQLQRRAGRAAVGAK